MDTSADRRKCARYEAEDGAFVFFGSEPTMAGKVLDVGKLGLGFTYLAQRPLTSGAMNLSLISTQRSFQCRSLTGTPVFDMPAQEEAANGKRRCGIEFRKLTKNQISDIESFIELCTIGPT